MQGSVNVSRSDVVTPLIGVCTITQCDESSGGISFPCPRVGQVGRSPVCHFSFVKRNITATYTAKEHGCHQLQQIRILWSEPAKDGRKVCLNLILPFMSSFQRPIPDPTKQYADVGTGEKTLQKKKQYKIKDRLNKN